MENHFFYQVEVIVGRDDIEFLEEKKMQFYEDFQSDGIEEYSLNEKEVDSILGEKSLSGGEVSFEVIEDIENAVRYQGETLTFNYFFYGEDAKRRGTDLFFYLESNFPRFRCQLLEKVELDWNEEWKKHYSPIEVSDEIRIVPSWFAGEKEIRDIFIHPGLGFGTGDHPTTYLCLELFGEMARNATLFERTLDFGCGSGILGIVALKKGAREVLFYDIDKNAIINTQQNIEINHLSEEMITCLDGSEKDSLYGKKFDLVFANILLETLKIEKKLIDSLVAENGILLLSGVLSDQLEEISHFYSGDGGYTIFKTVERKGWCAISLKKN